MRLLRYDSQELNEADLLDPCGIEQCGAGKITWIDIEGSDIELIAAIGNRLGVPALALEDIANTGQRPKVDEYDECLFIVVDHVSLDPEGKHVDKMQISIVVKNGVVVTVREMPGTTFDPVRDRLRSAKGRVRSAGTDYLTYALIDTVVDHYFPVLDTIGEQIAGIEERIDEQPAPDDVVELHRIRRNLILLRRSAWPLREMLGRLQHAEIELIQESTSMYLRDVADHLALIADMIETYREMVSGLMELHMSAASNRMNEVMKVLTIIATIFIPLSFIAGVYGMNFDPKASPYNMPELAWAWGYPTALALMAAVAAGLLLFFKRRHWL
jgi:magnesium transporter